ncbi:hypothetical protein U9M48_042405 [Paspalum notatum var. saurae]|uniref:Chalcone-flavonone isomerase family protein n=1 Tax=Paspalum notatum var. saurae TaxID=547442 RepID=A0AAQ3UUR0_PASNO
MAVSEVTVEGVVFPPVVPRPPRAPPARASSSPAQACERNGGRRQLRQEFKIAAIGVYLEDAAVPALAAKWGGKTGDELPADPAFFRDVYTGKTKTTTPAGKSATTLYVREFEKFTRVTFIWPRTVAAEEFSAKVMESRVAYLEAAGAYTDAEAVAVEEFMAAAKGRSFPPGGSVLFTHSPAGALTVAFSEDSSVPESSVGERSVSPATKQSIATRLPELLIKASGP